jgi:hypothetical protein
MAWLRAILCSHHRWRFISGSVLGPDYFRYECEACRKHAVFGSAKKTTFNFLI